MMPAKYTTPHKLPSCHLFADDCADAGPFPDLDYVSDFHRSCPGNEDLLQPDLTRDLVWNLSDLKQRIEAEGDGSGLFMFTSLTDSANTAELVLEFAWELSKEERSSVLILDCDLRSPALIEVYRLESGPGLSDFLTGAKGLRQIVKRTNLRNVWLVKSGLAAANPVTLLMSERLPMLVRRLQPRFDFILLNAPAYRVAVDAFVLAKFLQPTLVLSSSAASAFNSEARSIREELEILNLPVFNFISCQ